MNIDVKSFWLETLLVGLALVAYLSGMTQLELRAEEPRRALVSMEMVESGEYVVPHTYGMPYLYKPPLQNWCIAGLYKLGGAYRDWMVRLPGVLSLLIIAFLMFYFLYRNGHKEAAFPSAFIFLTFGDLLYYGSVNAGEIDLLYTLFIFAQTLGVYKIYKGKLLQGYLLAYIFCALAVLTKSLPAILFLGLTLLVLVPLERSVKKIFTWQHALGILVFSAIVAGYYFAYAQRGDLDILLANILQQGQDKNTLAQERYNAVLHVLEYPWIFIRIGLPWTLGLFLIIRKDVRSLVWNDKLMQFMLLFVLANVWIYWFIVANKIRYSYPFYPPLAIILGFLAIALPLLKKRIRVIYLVIGLMLIGRIGMNFILLPKMQSGQMSESYIHRELAEDVFEITKGAQVDLFAQKEYYEGTLPWDKGRTIAYERPGIIPYQIPYYINKRNGMIMQWVDDLEPQGFYIAPVEFLEKKGLAPKELLRFRNRWASQDIILFNSASLQE
jgi:4-amino-4-deoxy-L-arabinose transferase-like glycosyltransferase